MRQTYRKYLEGQSMSAFRPSLLPLTSRPSPLTFRPRLSPSQFAPRSLPLADRPSLVAPRSFSLAPQVWYASLMHNVWNCYVNLTNVGRKIILLQQKHRHSLIFDNRMCKFLYIFFVNVIDYQTLFLAMVPRLTDSHICGAGC